MKTIQVSDKLACQLEKVRHNSRYFEQEKTEMADAFQTAIELIAENTTEPTCDDFALLVKLAEHNRLINELFIINDALRSE
jgi:hypothetical protein